MAERQGFEEPYNLLILFNSFKDYRLFPHFFPIRFRIVTDVTSYLHDIHQERRRGK